MLSNSKLHSALKQKLSTGIGHQLITNQNLKRCFLASIIEAINSETVANNADTTVTNLLGTTQNDWKVAHKIRAPQRLSFWLTKSLTLGQYFEWELIKKGIKFGNHKRPLTAVANDIKSVFPTYYVSDQSGSNAIRVRLYNPLTGSDLGLTGQEQENDLMALCNVSRQMTTQKQLEDKIMSYLGSNAITDDKFVKGYHKTRYLLINGKHNGIVDITTFPTIKFYSLDKHQKLAQKLHFPSSSVHYIDWPQINPPLLKNELKYGQKSKEWNPQNFLNFIGGNTDPNSRMVEFSTVLLGMGFFCNHNSGVSIDIAAPSGAGKSSLIKDIYSTCYNQNEIMRKAITDFDQKDFPLNNLNNSTQIMILDEIDSTHHTLTNSLSRFDNLNDGDITVQVKNKSERTIENPPEVYGLGIKVLSSNHATDGLLRRLAILHFAWTKSWKRLAYARNLDEDLTDPRVVSYIFTRFLVCIRSLFIRVYFKNECGHRLLKLASDPSQIQKWLNDVTRHGFYKPQREALKKLSKDDQKLVNKTAHQFLLNKLDNLNLNLNDSNAKKLLPEPEKKLRKYILGDNQGLNNWFLDYIEPYLSKTSKTGKVDPTDEQQLDQLTILHPLLLFKLYSYGFYKEVHPDDTNFYKRMSYKSFRTKLSSVIEQNNYNTLPAGHVETGRVRARRQISYMGTINFNFARYCIDTKNMVPKDFKPNKDDVLGTPFGKKEPDWFYIFKNISEA